MIVPRSRLVQMLKENPRDSNGAVFFDFNPILFGSIIDQLRALKSSPNKSLHRYEFVPPFNSFYLNFTSMLIELGLTSKKQFDKFSLFFRKILLFQDDFRLWPSDGTHLDLSIDSLAGWSQCHHSSYEIPFDPNVFQRECNGTRFLLSCRSIDEPKTLKLAAVGRREEMFNQCSPKPCTSSPRKPNRVCPDRFQCLTEAKRGVGWFFVENQAIGFVRGSLSFRIDPCDPSDLDADYRLCWTMKNYSVSHRTDRCGAEKDLLYSKKWERLIFEID